MNQPTRWITAQCGISCKLNGHARRSALLGSPCPHCGAIITWLGNRPELEAIEGGLYGMTGKGRGER